MTTNPPYSGRCETDFTRFVLLMALTILVGSIFTAAAPVASQPRWVGLQPVAITVNMGATFSRGRWHLTN